MALQTGVWNMVEEVRSKFIGPVRQSLESNKVDIRRERESQRQGTPLPLSLQLSVVVPGREREGPEMSVEVEGEELPAIGPEEQEMVC